ncbi:MULTISPECIES: prepilin-type N-terminal cleavage/methylation domain-containing protein [Marinobacterium]|uniref:General secretion pathway protein I n=1 Tax=Marinobacterium iners DSM 11526 TaxID=1122198 RepID=A0A1H3YAH2_9GAMM|nr:prepilin-type N-terminal cleavage/methylation domain-containing protein [Marinobacterium iners]SEA07991.1 general secretion pathway protein I [Marinobacterium iners DSM 11526]
MRSSVARRQVSGFTLLEMLVSIVLLAMSLGALYHAVGGAMRAVGTDEKYVYAVELARSLVALNTLVEPDSTQQGETEGGFIWEVRAQSIQTESNKALPAKQLQDLRVQVQWSDTGKKRSIVLESVVAGRLDG